MQLALFLLTAILLLTAVSGFSMFWIGCARRKEPLWLDETIRDTSYGKYYDALHASDRFLRENHAQDVWMESHDGLQLHAHFIPADHPVGTVLLAHGYRSTKLLDFSAAYQMYHDWGLNLLVPDQRCHGKSQGKFITFGVKESRDMEGWIRYHNENLSELPIMLSGLSMGASTMLYLADRPLPGNVKGIIADCGFTSPKEILSEVYRKVIHLPAGPTVWMANLFAKVIAGFGLNEKDTRKTLADSRLPVLMVHGRADDFVPCAMTEEGFQACAEPKELLLIDGAGHGVSFLYAPERYQEVVKNFFYRCMGVRL